MRSIKFILLLVLGISIQCFFASTRKSNISADATSDNEKNCECAVFGTKTPTESQKPIINPKFSSVRCDRVITCVRFCFTMLYEMGAHFLDLLCAALGHYTNLTPHVHTRVCGAKRWFFTGMLIDKEVCCQDYKLIDCRYQTEAPFEPDDPLA
ncbi:hypothetical protein ILUMI_03547 [Ignelater luminosus]|uniref:Uncharacterized protein n=1 Tax=Ignelater luminosus TaxID=2038154 RepID=A0A8K0DAL2_IGNLU|nr:hypothetical protein ILUMI_03547 [Ignelater luminosus]